MAKLPTPTGAELTDAVRKGHRVSIYLEPDMKICNLRIPLPEYCETYPFPHMAIEDGKFWGATRRSHMVHQPHGDVNGAACFCYTNDLPLYGYAYYDDDVRTLQRGAVQLTLHNIDMYQQKHLVILPAGERVWSQEAPDEKDAIISAIQQGRSLYGVYRDENNVLRSHPLDLAFAFLKEPGICLTFDHALLPEMFASPVAFEDKLRRSIANEKNVPFEHVVGQLAFMVQIKTALFSVFRRVDRDQEPYGFQGDKANATHQCHGLEVYALP